MAVIGALLWFVPLSYTLAILVIVDLLHFLLVLLANTINIPIENSVNRYYYNDAKRILASMPNLTVIGVTGSYGKTSTKYILQKLLSAKYNVLMTPESYNTPMGVIRTVRTYLNATHEIFIVEMGAKNPGDIKEICDLVNPDYGIISSIGPQHLETFKTMDAICRTKFELAQAAKKKVFLNMNNEYIAREAGKHSHISYAIGRSGRLYGLKHLRWANGVGLCCDQKGRSKPEISHQNAGRH